MQVADDPTVVSPNPAPAASGSGQQNAAGSLRGFQQRYRTARMWRKPILWSIRYAREPQPGA